MSWTDERVELLRKLWREGRSAAQVANALGPGITRNAVIGKIHRLGLANRSVAASNTPTAPRQRAQRSPRAPAPSRGGVIMGNVAFALAPQRYVEPETLPQEVVVPITARVTLLDLRESMCRWPIGDPSAQDFRFCGLNKPIGAGPYCRHHASVAYQPAQDRRRRESMRGTG